ncbi:VC0807 family protein [Nocardioides mangrovi]|uniref:DUF3159 domain-containing protein n=1 Tax=Nocardioides mangrovi TaxID=2874580 RepID=A0ABS7UA76_9ACTN|nr:VC0807 family protein [Nocardioides mangrovi]MBZ5737898.1 hypothetical protein [Nocardioides mangrovi]
MTVTALALPAALPAPVTVARPHPCLAAVARRAGTNMAIGCLVPAAVFYTVVCASGVWTAIVAALVWSYGALGWRALTGRRTSGLLLLTTAVLTARTLVALLANSAFVYFLQPIVLDVAIATMFLLSLRTARPVVARLAADFYPLDDELAARPRIVRLFRGLTVFWAVLWLAKATIGLALLLSQPLETYVLVKGITVLAINATAMTTTLVAAAYVGRREGILARGR